MSNAEVIQALERGYRHPQPRQCPDEMYQIMLDCWQTDPQRRPTFEHLQNTMEDYNVATARQYADVN
jgi:hypothetical protein